MRVLLAPSAFAPHRGGVEELTAKLGEHLSRRGHEVCVLTNLHPDWLVAQEVVGELSVLRVPFSLPGRRPSSWPRYLRSSAQTRAFMKQLPKFDVAHVICASVQTRHVVRWADATGTALVLTTQGETEMDAGRLYQRSVFMRNDLRRASEKAFRLTACSGWAAVSAARVAPRFGGANVIPNGVDTDDWAMPPPTGTGTFAAWGRHVPQKGFDLLFEAFAVVRQHLPEARLILGGDGPETPLLRSRAPQGTTFVGSLDRSGVKEILRSAQVAVVPSRIEPFGIVALEALAAGRGLVYSKHGGLASAAGTCGRAADPFNPTELAAAMVAEMADLTPSGRGVAQAKAFDWHVLADHYVSIYDESQLSARRTHRGA